MNMKGKKIHTDNINRKTEGDSSTSTELMLNKLKSAQDIESFLDENQTGFYNTTISEHFDMLLKKYGTDKSEAIERADIERGYGYQILRGVKDARRDKYIRLAIGMGLDLDDTQRLLTIARHGILYSKVLRDAIIIFCINKHYDLMKLQLLLDEQNAAPLE